MFEDLGRLIREEVVLLLFHVELAPADVEQLQPAEQSAAAMRYEHEIAAGADVIAAAGGAGAVAEAAAATALADPPQPQQVVNEHRDIGRNDPCWCGSGKKFKKCHGA
jgi:preprotein translocase subunit SecA